MLSLLETVLIYRILFFRRRRKQWAGSVSGALSNNSPRYFQSGVSVCHEHGWWKLAQPSLTPRSVRAECKQYKVDYSDAFNDNLPIYVADQQRMLQRQQQRTERRLPVPDENSCGSDLSVTDHLSDAQASSVPAPEESVERLLPASEGCARAMWA